MSEKFRFTVITAFYNTGKYLKESIESVINQDIGFRENIQLILVDDGSSDNSYEIAIEYQKLYPDNIIALSKENGGVATARNMGLDYASGEFINFLDSDDTFPKDSFRKVDDFLKKNDVDIVAMPLIYFDKRTGEHHLNYKFENEGVVDLNEMFDYPLAHVASSFMKNDIFKKYRFNKDVVHGSDFLLMNEVLIDIKEYGVINSTHYNYRKRQDESSIMDKARYSKRFFTEKMKLCYMHLIDLSIKKNGYVDKFIQYIVALDLNGIITSPVFEDIFDNQKDLDEFWDCFNTILTYIDVDIIKNHRYLNNDVKSFLIYLKNNDFHTEVENNKILLKSNDYVISRVHKRKIHVDIIEITDDFLNISACLITKSNLDSINIEAIVKSQDGSEKVFDCKKVEYPTTYRKINKFLAIPWKYYHNFDLKIPLNVFENYKVYFKVNFHENNNKAVFNPIISFRDFCNINSICNYFVKDSKIVLFKDNAFHVVDYSFAFRAKLELKSIFNILTSNEDYKFYSIYIRIIYFLSFIFIKNRRIWLFMDRPTIADDNAKHLFKYSVKQNDAIDKYYIVDKNTDYYDEMLSISNNIIDFASLKHKIYCLHAEKIISSHVNHDWINPYFVYNQKLFNNLITIKRCFLQHGVTEMDVSSWLRKYYFNFYLFLTVSDMERDSIIHGNYNYSESVVQTLGFPRYDNLENKNSNKQILFMPTWRNYLKSDEAFISSKYYEFLNNFFNNKKLLNMVKDKGYTIVFKPHFELFNFLDLFNIPEDITINIKDSYQDLINNSSILITDYSSVLFDFAYLKKPVIYYRGDDIYHNKVGYFDFEKMGFGEIITSEDVLSDKIMEYIDNDCQMEDKYKKRVDEFFKFKDKNNCKRVYEWLVKNKG